MRKKQRPTIETERLRLRPFTLNDAPEIQRLAGDWDVASTTANIPYPYEDGIAEEWIQTQEERFEKGESVNLAITHRKKGHLIGGIGIAVAEQHERGGLGYWIGKPYWNNGYCTEALWAVLEYGFQVLGLNKIHGTHIRRNPASGRVMQKVGMSHEGSLRHHRKRWGKFEDVECYGILKSEYDKAN